jgi:hypothetical protein
MTFDLEPYWTLIVRAYDRRQRRKVRNIVQPTTIATPNRRLSDWEDTRRGGISSYGTSIGRSCG